MTITAATEGDIARILVVDDREDNRTLLLRRLRKIGYAVDEVDGGAAALDAIARAAPDLVLLDYNMPGMSGVETLRTLRATHDRSALPVIMVTAQNDDETIVESLDAGANDFVPKPIAFSVLTARIEAQLERQRSTRLLAALNEGLESLVEARTLDLRRRTTDLVAARDRAETASRAKSQFLERISHELRTPLNGVIGLADILRIQGPAMDADRLRACATEIHRSGLRLLKMITAKIEMTEIDGGGAAAPWTDFAYARMVSDAVDHLVASAQGPGPQIALSVDPSIGRCRGDRARLRQALFNLLSNAARFSPEGGVIEVRAVRRDGGVAVDVADRGPGVADDLLPILAEPFFAPADRDEARPLSGAGLGLAIARKALALHEGRLELRNRPGGGLMARMWLPDCRFVAAEPSAAAAS